MAGPTFSELQTRVGRRLIDAPPAVTAELPQLVLDAMTEVQDRFNFSWMREEVAFVAAAGTHVLGATPANFKEFREKPYWIEFTQGRVHKITQVRALQPAVDTLSDLQIGPPRLVFQDEEDALTGASNLLLYPLSDNASDWPDTLYRLRIPYYKYLDDLVSGSDTNVMLRSRRIVRFVVDWATKLGFEMNWDAAKAAGWEQTAEKEWYKIKNTEGSKALLGINTLVPHSDADYPDIAE